MFYKGDYMNIKIIEIHEYYLATNMGTGVTYNTQGWIEYNQDAPESIGKYTFVLNDKLQQYVLFAK